MSPVAERVFDEVVRGRRLACAAHEVDGDAVVLFSHGFRGERTGPNRTFVTAARRLAAIGVSSMRFDQHGSGDSAGDFLDSRFADWIDTIRELAGRHLEQGRRVALWGQSMGASAALCVAAELPVSAVVAWVPDASVDPFLPGPDGYVEEGGQRVGNEFWQQANDADVPASFEEVVAPCYLVFGTDDAYVSTANRDALTRIAKKRDRVDVFEGWPHSAWTAEQADIVIDRSIAFLAPHLADLSGRHQREIV